MNVIISPENLTIPSTWTPESPYVFLAGSIQQGTAIEWQKEIMNQCKDTDITFLNPRRDKWDVTLEQKITNKIFNEQVTWELDAMELADKIVVYIDPKTTSPITLMELGIHANSNKICVCCPEGFYRKGNVDIVCKYYNIPMVDDIEGLITFINEK